LLRNKEIRWFIATMSVITVVVTGVASIYSSLAALFVFIASILLSACSFFYTRWRYRELEKLSGYLRQISSGNYSLDVRDNDEGELSILKNDIYKVTVMLSEHNSLLKQDKMMLTDAISDISHQLKTPLTSMMMMADLLSSDELSSAKRKEFTRNIHIQLERIEWLVSSLLKLSKIDAGTAVFKKEQVSVKRLVDKALESIVIPMDIKGIELTVSGAESVMFTGDLNWTAEAILNILKNNVEHTPEGGKLNITFSENALYTEIVIEDNGIGIAKEDIPYLFQRFYKGKNASEGSIGIGLAMAHSIVTNQQGVIEVKSTVGKGTIFWIKFYKNS
jgi:signal transduction histidine kinase